MRASAPITRDLLLIGGGHAHALLLKMWGMTPLPGVRLTLVNPDPTAPYTGMLPGFVAGHYEQDEVEIDLVKLARFAGARLILGHVGALPCRLLLACGRVLVLGLPRGNVRLGARARDERVLGAVRAGPLLRGRLDVRDLRAVPGRYAGRRHGPRDLRVRPLPRRQLVRGGRLGAHRLPARLVLPAQQQRADALPERDLLGRQRPRQRGAVHYLPPGELLRRGQLLARRVPSWVIREYHRARDVLLLGPLARRHVLAGVDVAAPALPGRHIRRLAWP